MLGVDESVIRVVGLREHRKASGIVVPGESAAVDHHAAKSGAVAAHEFRQRMKHDIRSVIDGPHQHRGGDRVVDDQRHAVAVGDLGQCLEIADIACRVADGLAKYRARILVDQCLEIGGAVGFAEAHLNAHPRKNVGEQGVRGAV